MKKFGGKKKGYEKVPDEEAPAEGEEGAVRETRKGPKTQPEPPKNTQSFPNDSIIHLPLSHHHATPTLPGGREKGG